MQIIIQYDSLKGEIIIINNNKSEIIIKKKINIGNYKIGFKIMNNECDVFNSFNLNRLKLMISL